MGASWSRKGGWGIHPFKTPRRNLFELHAGRQGFPLPSNLLLDEMPPTPLSISKGLYTTSEELIAALGPIGLEYINPSALNGKMNLSYLSNPMLLTSNRKEAIKEATEGLRKAKIARKEGKHAITMKELFIQYLRHVDPILKYQARSKNPNFANEDLDDALLELLNKENTSYLNLGGYDITDLMTWSWVLKSETPERAATRLLAAAHQRFTKLKGYIPIPQFVFIFLLRRQGLNAHALRSLLIYAWKLMEISESSLESFPPLEKLVNEAARGESLTITRIVKSREDDPLGMTERVFMIVIIRLLRSARRVWPAAYDSIVALINRYLDGVNFREGASPTDSLTSEDTARLTYMYNTLLKLVSLPASIGPYQSAFHQQRAQFSLLRRMNQFQPPLIVDRRGYRAVVSMQLMHKKTLKEREWAQMKARSWPPWKEEKLGIDADIGVEHGISRAMEALKRSWEAGYAPDNWDATASVLSGWDTDASPTIQTRVVHYPHEHRTEHAQIWASRIRATRTLDEAWSCFLSYRDQEREHVGAFYVYHQMLEKIVQDSKRPPTENADSSSTHSPDEQLPLSGDGLEVLAAPESPREAVYVRRPPPTFEEFVEVIAQDKIRPGKRLLKTMLTNAPTLETGLQYLEASVMANLQVFVLCDEKPPSTPEAQAALESVPLYLFCAFIRLLTRFSPKMPDKTRPDKLTLVRTGLVLDSIMAKTKSAHNDVLQGSSELEQSLELSPSPKSIVINPLLKAIQLVLARKPRYRPAWYSLLQALSNTCVVIDVVSRFVDQNYQDIKTWQMTCHLLNEMLEIDLTLDLDGFQILCAGLEKAIFASDRLSRNPRIRPGNSDPKDENMRSYVDHVFSTGLPLLKEIFKDVVRSKSMKQEIPVSLMEEKSKIDDSVEGQGVSKSDDIEEEFEDASTTESRAFLPPGCLLPRLLEVPHPACLHGFVRVLGLRRDYEGLVDLVEWMSLFADEINAVADQKANGYRMMRRCLTAIHVFLERSWLILEKREAEAQGEDPSTVRDEQEMKAEAAPAGVVKVIQEIVRENKRWGGWPDPYEVVQYCANGKFI